MNIFFYNFLDRMDWPHYNSWLNFRGGRIICVGVDGSFEGHDDYLQYDRTGGFLKILCLKIMSALATNHQFWQSNHAKPLCSKGHFAKYAVIDRTKAESEAGRIVCYLCEFHGCLFEALTYQAKALLPHQYILALIYLKDKK